MDQSRAIDGALSRAVEAGRLVGVVGAAWARDGLSYEGAFGRRGVDQDADMTVDTVMWIASMTKAVTGAAVMQLVERGRLDLDAPAGDHVAFLREVQVLEGFDEEGRPLTRPPRTPVTLRHLLTHTAGFGYGFIDEATGRYTQVKELPDLFAGRQEAFETPLLFDPGERWEYGVGIDWAGRVVEEVSGQRLDEYCRVNLFEPLGMADTGYEVRPDQRSRLASMHARTEDGGLAAIPFGFAENPEMLMGGGGLYSTAPDYVRFNRMILGGGELDGRRVLGTETVSDMCRNHIGDVQVKGFKSIVPQYSNDVDFYPGMEQRWGLSFLINMDTTPEGRSAGSLAWAGLANSYFWIDVTRGVTGVFLTQLLPFFDAAALDAFRAFETAVYGALGSPGDQDGGRTEGRPGEPERVDVG